MQQETKHLEIKTYTHLGIEVQVEIDYDEEHISLLDGKKTAQHHYAPKQWVFANRGLEYMQGWRNIFKAMEHAIGGAEVELKRHVDAANKRAKKRTIEIARAVGKIK